MRQRKHLPLLCAVLALQLSAYASASASAKQDCEAWARDDNISAMLWDRYVDACIASLQGEDINESSGEEDAPSPTPTQANKREPEADKAY